MEWLSSIWATDGYLPHGLCLSWDPGLIRLHVVSDILIALSYYSIPFPMELSVGEVLEGGQRLFTGFVRDLTERQQAERHVRELQMELSHVSRVTEMGQVASGIAHEVNQPLAAAAVYLQGLRRLMDRGDPGSRERAKAAIDSTIDQITRATAIIRRVRGFLRKSEPERRPENVVTLIEEANAVALIGSAEQDVQVRFNTDPHLPDIFVDKVQIQQVLVNLARNAVEAMASSARRELVIAANRHEAGLLAIRVADSGPGIAREIADRLFQPFVTSKAQGMGLGLSLCRKIIEAHGGRLWTEANPGGGTVFGFTVPIAG